MPQDRSLPYIIGLVVLLAIAVILFVSFPSLFTAQRYPSGSVSPGVSPRSSGEQASLQELQKSILAHSKIVFPKIASATNSTVTNLPVGLKVLLPKELDPQNQLVQRLVYSGGRTGYLMTFSSSISTETAVFVYRSISQLPGRTFLFSAQRDIFSIVEIEDATYRYRASITLVGSNSVVSVQVIRK